jgi:hypothetical protein
MFLIYTNYNNKQIINNLFIIFYINNHIFIKCVSVPDLDIYLL